MLARTLIAAACLALLATAQAQTGTEQPIQTAFEALRMKPGLQVTLEGTQTVGETSDGYRTTVYWFQTVQDGRLMILCEAVGEQNGTMAFRIVADGVVVWAYDARRNEYSATRYGNYSGAQPENYHNALLGALGSVIQGRSALPIRLLNQVYGGDRALYRSWMPGATPSNEGVSILYQLGNPVRRRLEFFYTTTTTVTLNGIEYFDRVLFGASERQIEWGIDLLSFETQPEMANFSFVPPAGARAIAGVRPVTSG